MLKLWGRLSSINVRKVVWTLQALGLPFERTDAGLDFGIVKTPAYLQQNPNALVPLLDDNGFTLWESNVIVRYLCARHSHGNLYPLDLPARFDAERWMDWQQTTMNPAGRTAFIQRVRTPAEQRNPELIAQSVAAMTPLLAMVETQLAQRTYIAADHLTMADIPIACEIHRWWGLPQPRAAWPHIERWYQDFLAHPASHGVLDAPSS